MSIRQFNAPCRPAIVVAIFALLLTGPASSQTFVRKLNDDVWIDWRLINAWSVHDVQRAFAPGGETVHISTPIPQIPVVPTTNNPVSPPKTPIDPWCDCPEEYRIQIKKFLPSVPVIHYQPFWTKPFDKSIIYEGYPKAIEQGGAGFDTTMEFTK